MPKYLSQIDASQIPVKGLVPESSATAPANPVEGQLYYDTTLKMNRSYQNGSWVNISQGATYSVPSQAEAEAGTATTGRVFSAQRVAQAINALQAVKSVAGKTGAVTLVKADVGLSNVDNTADSAKPVSTAQQTALNLKANLASPTFTGVPAAPTAAVATNTTQLATTAFVQAVANGLKAGLTKADVGLGNVDNTSDANKPVSTATQTALNLKANIASPTFTGSPKAPTAASSTNTTQLATTAFVQTVVSNMAQGISAKNTVRVATTQGIAMSGLQTIDGVSVVAGDSVLVKNQSSSSTNGIYVVGAGTWARREDADTWDELVSAFTFVQEGSTQADTGWLCSADRGGILGSTEISWVQFSSAGQIEAGDGLTKAGNTISIADGGVGLNQLGNSSVSRPKILSGAVSEDKLGDIPLTSSKFTGILPVTKGGTGVTNLTDLKGPLGIPTLYDAEPIPALTAGVWASVLSSKTTTLPVVEFMDVETKERVILDTRLSGNTIQVRSDVSLAAGTIEAMIVDAP